MINRYNGNIEQRQPELYVHTSSDDRRLIEVISRQPGRLEGIVVGEVIEFSGPDGNYIGGQSKVEAPNRINIQDARQYGVGSNEVSHDPHDVHITILPKNKERVEVTTTGLHTLLPAVYAPEVEDILELAT